AVEPVHSREEIERLHRRFPENFKLFLANIREELLAGAVVYETRTVAHVQYIASSERGRDCGALDKLFLELLAGAFRDKPFFDYGMSNQENGRVLNKGLIEQKEGFGGRAVVHDFYTVPL
ncbi:MAG: GNAT family N-acetyltransferase, partial [Bradyrhizobium sp.]